MAMPQVDDQTLVERVRAGDWQGVTGRKPNVQFMNTVDAEGFYDLLTERLSRLNGLFDKLGVVYRPMK